MTYALEHKGLFRCGVKLSCMAKFFEFFKLLLDAAGRNAGGVLVRIFVPSIVGIALGIILFLYWHRLMVRRGWMNVDPHFDPIIRLVIMPVWALIVPFLSLMAALVMGCALACAYVVEHEHLGVEAGRLAFRAIVVAAALQQKGAPVANEQDRLAYAKKLINGEETIPIDTLRAFDSRTIAELSASKMEKNLPAVGNPLLRRVVVIVMDRSIAWFAAAATPDQADIILKLSRELVRIDDGTDRDGRVTAEEVSQVLSRLFIEKKITALIMEIGAAKAMISLVPLALFLAFPPFAALCTRGIIAYRKRRRKRDNEASPADSPSPADPPSPADGTAAE